MQMGEVIRKYRKERNLTQEEVATRLGVTASAVNKWEKGNSYPDIQLLAPIARLLGVTLDALLSFQEDLSREDIDKLAKEANEHLKNQSYEEAFRWAKNKIEVYPNCEWMIWQLALIFDVWRCFHTIPETDRYDDYLISCYVRILDSKDEKIRCSAADSLFSFYLRKEQYSKAEEYLAYFSKQDPERERKQALIYSKTNRVEEAYKAYEELLFAGHNMLSMIFQNFYMLAVEMKDMEKAKLLVGKQKQLTVLFDMGEYRIALLELDGAVESRDVEKTLNIMETMIANVRKMDSFCESPLYEHMVFKELSEEFINNMENELIQAFQDENKFDYLKSDKRWQQLVKIK